MGSGKYDSLDRYRESLDRPHLPDRPGSVASIFEALGISNPKDAAQKSVQQKEIETKVNSNQEELVLGQVPIGGVIYFIGAVIPPNYREMQTTYLLKADVPALMDNYKNEAESPTQDFIVLESPSSFGVTNGNGKWIVRVE